jgi:lipopolysaccharide transport system ATP-binding protein
MYYVSAFCQRALWLRHGRVAALGPVDEVVREYENFLLAKGGGGPSDPAAGDPAAGDPAAGDPAAGDPGSKPARLIGVRLLGERGEASIFRCRQPWTLEVEWQSDDPGRAFHLGVGIDRVDGVQVCSFGTRPDGLPPTSGERRHRARLLVPELPILKGDYTIYVFLLDEEGLHIYDQAMLHPGFTIETEEYRFGLMRVEHSWDLVTAGGAEVVSSAPARRAGV